MLASVLVCTGPSASEPFDVVTTIPDLRGPSPSCCSSRQHAVRVVASPTNHSLERVLRVETCCDGGHRRTGRTGRTDSRTGSNSREHRGFRSEWGFVGDGGRNQVRTQGYTRRRAGWPGLQTPARTRRWRTETHRGHVTRVVPSRHDHSSSASTMSSAVLRQASVAVRALLAVGDVDEGSIGM